MKKSCSMIFFSILFIYLEFIFNIFVFNNINYEFIYIVLFSLFFGIISYLLSNIFKSKINHVISYLFVIGLIFIFISQFVYNRVYLSIISIFSIVNGGGGQVLQFFNQIVDVIKNNWYVILLFLLPLIIYIVLDILKLISYERTSIKSKLCLLGSSVAFYICSILLLFVLDNGSIYSTKHLYFDVHAPLLTTNKMGVMTMMRLDLKRYIFGFVEKDIEIVEDKVELNDDPVIEYNVLNIDFDKLISEESDETIKSMHEYFSNQLPSKKNDYTGMFEGKNLVVFVAEAFSNLAIDENLTPTLYKLYSEGFQFDNFYTPLFPVSTADGEYITDTSLIPKEGVWSLAKINGNYMPFSYANIFESLGYSSNAYHNNTATYYNRNQFISTMGYDSFKACRAGLNINCRIWPQSDLEMIDASYNDYINNDKFLAYYMTVSGHLEYTKLGNMMVTRNWDKVKDLELSHRAKSYIACQMELDKAVARLIEILEENGKLDDTVIVISGDHYPYGLTLDEVNELSDYERDSDFEIHHMPLLIWNSAMNEPVKVTKYSSSLDVLPTVLNLFGAQFDSRLLMGRDILSDSEGLVIFSNRSFITKYGKYNNVTKKLIRFDEEIEDGYIDKISNSIYNKYKYSRLILEKNYYKILYDSLGWEIKK